MYAASGMTSYLVSGSRRGSLFEVHCGVNSFSPEPNECLRTYHHHCSGILGGRPDLPLGIVILMVSIWNVGFVCNSTGCKHHSEGQLAIIAPESINPISLVYCNCIDSVWYEVSNFSGSSHADVVDSRFNPKTLGAARKDWRVISNVPINQCGLIHELSLTSGPATLVEILIAREPSNCTF
jgi:hypothetical protein